MLPSEHCAHDALRVHCDHEDKPCNLAFQAVVDRDLSCT